jgi:hypothetical protein
MSEPEANYDMLSEVLDRSRRIETRLTGFLEAQGYDTRVRRPVFKDGELHVQSAGISLSECMAALPEWHRDETAVVFNGEVLCWIARQRYGE